MKSLETLRQNAIADKEIPEGVRHFLEHGACLEDIRLSERGIWFHQGEPFINEKLSDLFHRSLGRTEKGTWFLHIAPYTYPVTVELTDTFVHRLLDDSSSPQARIIGKGAYHQQRIDLSTLYSDGDQCIATLVEGKPARLVDTAYRQVLDRLDEDQGTFVVRFQDKSVAIQPLPEGFFL